MNRKRITKRVSLVALLVIMVLSFFCGTSFYAANGNSVMADTIEIIDSEGVTKEQTLGGVRISSDTAYEAKIAGVFRGNSSVTFNLDGDFDSWFKQGYALENIFNFRVSSITNPSVFFDVAYTYLDDYDFYYKYNISVGNPYEGTTPYVKYTGDKTEKERLFGQKLAPILYYSEKEPGGENNIVRTRYGYNNGNNQTFYDEYRDWWDSRLNSNNIRAEYVTRAVKCFSDETDIMLSLEWEEDDILCVYYYRTEPDRTKPVDADGYPLDKDGNRIPEKEPVPQSEIIQFYKTTTGTSGVFELDGNGERIPAYYQKTTMKSCLAKFDDGQYNCYLPKMDILKGGYTITLMSDCPYVTFFKTDMADANSGYGYMLPFDNETENLKTNLGITVNKICDGETEIDLSANAYEQKGAFKEYKNFIGGKAAINVVEDYALEGLGVGNSFVVPKAVYSVSGKSGMIVSDVKIEYNGKSETVSCGDTYTIKEVGEHSIVYTVGSATEKIIFDVIDSAYSTSELFSGTNMSFRPTSEGVRLHRESENFEAQICGEFNGNFDLTYATTLSYSFSGIYRYEYLRMAKNDVFLALKATDKSGQSFYVVNSWNGSTSNIYVVYEYNDKYYHRSYLQTGNNEMTDKHTESMGFAPYFISGQDWLSDATISFTCNKGILSVEAVYNRKNKVLISEFDGTFDKDDVKGGFNSRKSAWGLPFFDYENGYTVSIVSYSNGRSETGNNIRNDLLIKSINGVNLANKGGLTYNAVSMDLEIENSVEKDGKVYIPQGAQLASTAVYTLSLAQHWNIVVKEEKEIAELSSAATGEKSITVTSDYLKEIFPGLDTVSVTKNIVVQNSYTISFDPQNGTEKQTLLYSDDTKELISIPNLYKEFYILTGWFIDGKPWSGNLKDIYGKNVELVARWMYLAYPDITFKSGLRTSYVVGDKFVVSYEDLSVRDDQGKLSFAYKVIAPDKTEKEYRNGSAIILSAGIYTLQYSATNEKGYVTTVTREINVAAYGLPVITLQSEPVTQTIKGKTITLPEVTAVDAAGNIINAISSFVMHNGKHVDVKNGKFIVEAAGEYTVTFVAQDSDGIISVYEYTVTAFSDDVAPTIIVDYEDCEVPKGATVTLPYATATDNVDETVATSITVWYGMTQVEVNNNCFTAAETGVYTIRIEAVDSSNNRKVLTYRVIVLF